MGRGYERLTDADAIAEDGYNLLLGRRGLSRSGQVCLYASVYP